MTTAPVTPRHQLIMILQEDLCPDTNARFHALCHQLAQSPRTLVLALGLKQDITLSLTCKHSGLIYNAFEFIPLLHFNFAEKFGPFSDIHIISNGQVWSTQTNPLTDAQTPYPPLNAGIYHQQEPQ